ncbi:MAG: GNAT family N-acetyltransferase [Acidobacteriota bacterium]
MAVHDVSFRAMTAADIDGGLRLTRAAGWNQLRRDWEMFLQRSPAGCYVAEKAGIIVGTAATIRYQEHFSWIGMVLVDPAERGRGIGWQLIRRVVEDLASENCIRLDATPAGESLYRRFDFRRECGIIRMQAEPPSGPRSREPDHQTMEGAPAPVTSLSLAPGSGARPIVEDDLPVISRLDSEVFGADRAFLLRWVWQGAPEYGWAVEGLTGLEAYIFGRHGYDFEHLGPIVAPSGRLARELVAACLPAVSGRPVIIDAKDEPAWLSSLSALGFREQRRFVRMFLGEEVRPARTTAQWGFLGPEFG